MLPKLTLMDGDIELLVIEFNPHQQDKDGKIDFMVNIAIEENSGNLRLQTAYIPRFDAGQYNALGLLKALLDQVEPEFFENTPWGTKPEEMSEPPRSRVLPPLGELVRRRGIL